MEQERAEEQVRLYELNKIFLAEVENGADWADVKYIMDEMREVARRIEYLQPVTARIDNLQPATVLAMNSYPLNKIGQQGI